MYFTLANHVMKNSGIPRTFGVYTPCHPACAAIRAFNSPDETGTCLPSTDGRRLRRQPRVQVCACNLSKDYSVVNFHCIMAGFDLRSTWPYKHTVVCQHANPVLSNLFDTVSHWKNLLEAKGRTRKLKSKNNKNYSLLLTLLKFIQ
jgi:hypothetical protein